MKNEPPSAGSTPPPPRKPNGEPPFGANEVRLTGRQWLVALAILTAVIVLTPVIWGRIMRFRTGPDYRIPYTLSNDYWLYGQRLQRAAAEPDHVFLVGDSVIWGEYVRPDGTLSHFLNREAGTPDRYINAGVNGLFPLAMEGLLEHYGSALRGRKVVVHCNLLWMTSPRKDLSAAKPEPFNHSRIVPQFSPRLPSYRASNEERVSAVVERHFPFIAWTTHLQDTCFGQKSIPQWTLETVPSADGATVSTPNVCRNPLARISLTVPEAPADDPDRGPASARHQPWSTNGVATMRFDWVAPEKSLQVQAFERLVRRLRSRGNDVLVVIGPFNEHMLLEENRAGFRALRDRVAATLAREQVPCVIPALLPSELYADASHPLTAGYEQLARQLRADPAFAAFCGEKR
jgi:hypothetical protein